MCRKGNHSTLWVVQPVWKIVWRLLKNLKIELPFLGNPTIPFLGLDPEKMKILLQKDHLWVVAGWGKGCGEGIVREF